MKTIPYMYAHRKLRWCLHYHPYRECVSRLPDESLKASLCEGETLLGIYENVPGSLDRCVAITDRGLILKGADGWVSLPYAEMASHVLEVGPRGEFKLTVEEITLNLRGGGTASVPVLGEYPQWGGRDIFSMSMFLDHVLGGRGRRLAEPVSNVVGAWSPEIPQPTEAQPPAPGRP